MSFFLVYSLQMKYLNILFQAFVLFSFIIMTSYSQNKTNDIQFTQLV